MASVIQQVGNQPKARGRQGENQSSFYNRSGIAFGQRITGRNGRPVQNNR